MMEQWSGRYFLKLEFDLIEKLDNIKIRRHIMRPVEILKDEHKVIKCPWMSLRDSKEDNILYVMVDAHLDESTEEDLKEKYLGGKNGQGHQ